MTASRPGDPHPGDPHPGDPHPDDPRGPAPGDGGSRSPLPAPLDAWLDELVGAFPEVRDSLVQAADSLLDAARSVLDAADRVVREQRRDPSDDR